jgi:nucleoside phosphorylase
MAAAKLMLDALHPSLPRPPTDQNTYILGNIGEHNIVIACLPSGAYGNISAATVAIQLLSNFHSIRFGLMVGIGGGIPSSGADIRLGDIVVSQPVDTSGGVIQYDLGKALDGQFQRTGMLNRPPKTLLTALSTLQAYHFTEDSRVLEFISDAQVKATPRRAANFARPTQEDCLYQADYLHGSYSTCAYCDRSKLASRPLRDHDEPLIHYGLIASANQVVKDGRRRDRLAQDLGASCVEMEAAGLMNDFPCLVIRGICDYADSHKNNQWQGYAAVAAAAYAKELLLVVPTDQIDITPTARDTLADSGEKLSIRVDSYLTRIKPNLLLRVQLTASMSLLILPQSL